MEIIKNFGLDPILLIAQIVNFLIILYILRRFLYKPILKTLENRKATIKEGLDKTEEATIRLEKIQEKEKRIFKSAHDQARKILDETKKESLEVLQKTEDESKIRAEDIIKQAREQINSETRVAEKRLTLHVSRLAVDFIKKAKEDLFSKEDQELIMRNVLKRLEKTKN